MTLPAWNVSNWIRKQILATESYPIKFG